MNARLQFAEAEQAAMCGSSPTEGFGSFTFTVMQRGEREVEEIAGLSVHYRMAVGTRAAGDFTSKPH